MRIAAARAACLPLWPTHPYPECRQAELIGFVEWSSSQTCAAVRGCCCAAVDFAVYHHFDLIRLSDPRHLADPAIQGLDGQSHAHL